MWQKKERKTKKLKEGDKERKKKVRKLKICRK